MPLLIPLKSPTSGQMIFKCITVLNVSISCGLTIKNGLMKDVHNHFKQISKNGFQWVYVNVLKNIAHVYEWLHLKQV